jgi:hypothetical protein
MSHSILNFLKNRKIKPLGQRQATSATGQPETHGGVGLLRFDFFSKWFMMLLYLCVDMLYPIQTKNLLGSPGRLCSLVRQTKKPGLFVGGGLLRLLGHG